MSTTSGFIVGLVAAASLTVMFSGEISGNVEQVMQQLRPAPVTAARVAEEPETAVPALLREVNTEPVRSAAATEQSGASTPTLEQRWSEYREQSAESEPAGEFPWRACFRRASAAHNVPETLLLAVASGESSFDPGARSGKDAVGLMQIRWPDTARHLGVRREADLYDPCTNVDAGARYLAELAGRFDNNLHLAVAAYNYGPGRIAPGNVPEGANWYSQYIYQHLQQILGEEHLATSKLMTPVTGEAFGQLVLMRFNRSQRARDFIAFLGGEVPDLDLQQRSEAMGQHEVVLLYESETERRRALEAIDASGLATISSSSQNKLSL